MGKPILYATTDNFLKRFKLNSIDELPDYDELMKQIAELNSSLLAEDEEDANYLYKRDEYVENEQQTETQQSSKDKDKKAEVTEDGFELPEFISDDDDVIKID